MKRLYGILVTAAAGLSVLSCGLENPDTSGVVNTIAVTVADFPVYGTASKAVGIPDPGKTEWTDGDVILVSIGSEKLTLTYRGSQWNFNEEVTAAGPAEVSAYYAPDYEWAAGDVPRLLSGKSAGTDEYLVYGYEDDNVSDGIVIDFSGVRDYSRFRVAATPGAKVSLTGDFVPVGTETPLGVSSVETEADENANAFFYGTWDAASEVEFDVDGTKYPKTLAAAGVVGKSYVLDATPGYVFDEESNTLTVTNAKGMVYFASIVNDGSNPDVNVVLENDIDLSSVCGEGVGNWTPVGNNTVENGKYSGVFDGKNHTISGMYYSSDAATNYVGLFGLIAGASVRDLNVTGTVNVPQGQYIGGISGWMEEGALITGCSFDGDVTGRQYTGCVVGRNDGATVENTVNNGSVTVSGSYAGGIAGYCTASAAVVACVNNGSVSTNRYSGGIVGYNRGSSIIACCNLSDNLVSGGYIGGIAAYNNEGSVIVSSYSTGTFDIDEGAIACNNTASEIKACYWSGDIENAFTRGSGTAEAFKVDGATITWTTGEGSANAMEYMNAAIPAEYLWHFVPTSDPKTPLLPKRTAE